MPEAVAHSRRRRREGRLSGGRAAGVARRGRPDLRPRRRGLRRRVQSRHVLPGHERQGDRRQLAQVSRCCARSASTGCSSCASTGRSRCSPTTSSASACCASAGSSTGTRSSGAQRVGTFNVYNFSKNKLEVIEPKDMNEDLLVACVTLPMWFPPVTIDGDRYIDGVYLTDANLRRRSAAAPTSSGSSGPSAARRNGRAASSTPTSRSSRRPPTASCSATSTASRPATRRSPRARAGSSAGRSRCEMLAAEVPLHYLINVASPEFTAAVEQGIADARAWCREKGITLTWTRQRQART